MIVVMRSSKMTLLRQMLFVIAHFSIVLFFLKQETVHVLLRECEVKADQKSLSQ